MTANGTTVQFHSGEVFSPFKILLSVLPPMELERQTLMGSTDKQYYSIIYHENLASENINFSEFHFMTYYISFQRI